MIDVATAIRPTFLEMWLSYHFDLPMLVETSGVSDETVQKMLNCLPVAREDAEKVLSHLSTILHRECSLNTMHVPLIQPPVENKSEVAKLTQRINDEYESGKQAITGVAIAGRHDFISKRMENIYGYLQALRVTVGEEAAMQAVIAWDNQETQQGRAE